MLRVDSDHCVPFSSSFLLDFRPRRTPEHAQRRLSQTYLPRLRAELHGCHQMMKSGATSCNLVSAANRKRDGNDDESDDEGDEGDETAGQQHHPALLRFVACIQSFAGSIGRLADRISALFTATHSANRSNSSGSPWHSRLCAEFLAQVLASEPPLPGSGSVDGLRAPPLRQLLQEQLGLALRLSLEDFREKAGTGDEVQDADDEGDDGQEEDGEDNDVDMRGGHDSVASSADVFVRFRGAVLRLGWADLYRPVAELVLEEACRSHVQE